MGYQGKKRYSGKVVDNHLANRKSKKWDLEQTICFSLLKKLPEGTRIVDAPVGTGRFFKFYDQLNHDVTGLDISQDMLAKSKELAPSTLNLNLYQGDAEKIELDDNYCDYVVSFRFCNWLPPEVLSNVIREFSRISRKGLIIEIRTIKDMSIFEAVKHFSIKKTINHIQKSISKNKYGTNAKYQDYYLHHEKEFINKIKGSFKIVSEHVVDVRYDIYKLKKYPFVVYECEKTTTSY